MTSDKPIGAFIELSFAPNILLVSVVRRFISNFYGQLLRDPAAVSRLAVATHELLENAVRYSADGLTRLRVEMVGAGNQARAVVRTWNKSQPEHIATLRSHMAELGRATDPMAFYLALLHRVARQESGSGLGLGLGRICAETEMTLVCEVEGSKVCVIGEAPLGSELKP